MLEFIYLSEGQNKLNMCEYAHRDFVFAKVYSKLEMKDGTNAWKFKKINGKGPISAE